MPFSWGLGVGVIFAGLFTQFVYGIHIYDDQFMAEDVGELAKSLRDARDRAATSGELDP